MGEVSRYIPEHIRLIVRQRDSFACVICGRMPTQYHHVKDFAHGGLHEVDNLVLLCNNHHDDFTWKRRSSAELVFYLKNNPPKRTFQKIYQIPTLPTSAIFCGGSQFEVRDGQAIRIFSIGENLFLSVRMVDNTPIFSCSLGDFTGDHFLKIEDNVILINASELWDVRLRGSSFKVFHRNKKLLMHVSFEESELVVQDLRFFSDGVAVRITENLTTWNNGPDVRSFSGTFSNYYNLPNLSAAIIGDGSVEGYTLIKIPSNGKLSKKMAMEWLSIRESDLEKRFHLRSAAARLASYKKRYDEIWKKFAMRPKGAFRLNSPRGVTRPSEAFTWFLWNGEWDGTNLQGNRSKPYVGDDKFRGYRE